MSKSGRLLVVMFFLACLVMLCAPGAAYAQAPADLPVPPRIGTQAQTVLTAAHSVDTAEALSRKDYAPFALFSGETVALS